MIYVESICSRNTGNFYVSVTTKEEEIFVNNVVSTIDIEPEIAGTKFGWCLLDRDWDTFFNIFQAYGDTTVVTTDDELSVLGWAPLILCKYGHRIIERMEN